MDSVKKRIDITLNQRNKILERDDFKCLKCYNNEKLEVHHIIPVIFGGSNDNHNLITLCHSCHKIAPNDPIEFFKWAKIHLPFEMSQSKTITKVVVGLISYYEIRKKELLSSDEEDKERLFEWIDNIYDDLWKVYLNKEQDGIGIFFTKYLSPVIDKHSLDNNKSDAENKEV